MRRALLALGAVVLLIAAGAGIFAATFDANAYKPRIEAAVEKATGRKLSLNGPVSLSLSPLGLAASDASFANAPGGSQPEMAKAGRLEAGLALLPLLSRRIEITRLTLVHPDILLERGPDGRGNWQFAVEKHAAEPEPSGQAGASKPWTVSIDGAEIDDGVVTWRGAPVRTLALKRLTLRESADDAPISIDADAAFDGAPFTLAGTVGPLAGLREKPASPWPVNLAFASGAAKLSFDGSLTSPLTGRGYDGKLDGTAPDLAALSPFLPGVALPDAHDLRVAAQVKDVGAGLPAFSALALHLGASDLGALAPDLKIEAADVSADRLDQPVKADVRGSYAGAPLVLNATLGAPAALLPGAKASGPWPVDVTAQAAGASLTAKGGLAAPQSISGADVAVTAKIPDMAALSPLLRARLPALHDVVFAAHVADEPGGFSHGVALRDVRLASREAELTGEATLGLPRPSLSGTLSASRLDLDAVLAAPKPAPDAAAAPAPSKPEPRAKSRYVISDRRLPFETLRGADADLTLKIAALRTGGADYRNVDGRLKLAAGKLRLDPFAADLPAGHLSATLDIDAAKPAPPVALTVHAPQLQAKPVALLFGLPGDVSGIMDVDLDIRGAGESPHAIAAGADGHLGIALVNGTLDKSVIGPVLADILHTANFDASGRGTTALRCLAVRADVAHGLATLRALTLDTDEFALDGGGTVNLADEALDLRVRPLVRIKGAGVSVPLDVGGTLAAPRSKIDVSPGAAVKEAETVGKMPFGLIIGTLTGQSPGADVCASSLQIARGGQAGPAAAPPPAVAQKSAKPADLLRQLFK